MMTNLLRMLSWEAVVSVRYDADGRLWFVSATWDDFHGANLRLYAEEAKLLAAVKSIEAQKELADEEMKP